VLAALATLAVPASAQATTYRGPASAQRAVVILHGGGFAYASAADTEDTARAFANAGYRAVNLSYPLRDLWGAKAALKRAIDDLRRPGRRIYTYGESAGGGMSALAAAERWVDGAYAWAPVSDLVAWRHESIPGFATFAGFKDRSIRALKAMSAITYASKASAPLFVDQGRDDVHVPIDLTKRLKKRWGKRMTIRWWPGGHVGNPMSAQQSTEAAIRFIGRIDRRIVRDRHHRG
jgi:acetyl esterase/lipase